MKTNSIAILALSVFNFFLNVSPVFSQTTSIKEKSDQQIKKEINPEPEMLMRIDQLSVKVDSISAFIRSTQTAVTELEQLKKDLSIKETEIEQLKSNASSAETNAKKEIEQINLQMTELVDKNNQLQKQVISTDFCKTILKKNAFLDDLTLQSLISAISDQATLDDLKRFQNKSKIISAAETFLRDGSNRASYGKIYIKITTLTIDTKFPEQAKEAMELKFKMIYFDSYIRNVNKLILSLKDVTDKTSREHEIERSDSFQKIKSLKWLAELCNENMQKHVDLGIKF